MTTAARFAWCLALIVAGTIGALFLPFVVCLACDLGAGYFAVRGARA